MARFTGSDRMFMKKAIELAEKGRGHTAPNPMVGAVITKDGRIISEGFHKKAGGDHAEIDAVKNSTEPVRGAAMYVSLEPCTVSGKTPPCVDEIIKRGFKKVVIGAVDPNPDVKGRGINTLKEAGIEVDSGLFEKEVRKQNEVFFKNMKEGMPFVCAKIASSIDGKLAAGTSDSRWITGPVSRKKVQGLRWEYGCVLTGINSVLADDPTLIPRADLEGDKEKNIVAFLAQEESSRFTRVILDTDLKMPADSAILRTADRIKTIVFTGSGENKEVAGNNHLIMESSSKGTWEPGDILKVLYKKHGITSVMLEAGPSLLTSFLNNGLIDKFMIFFAPKIIGSESNYDMFGHTGVKKIKDSIGLQFDFFEASGDDILITAYPTGGGE